MFTRVSLLIASTTIALSAGDGAPPATAPSSTSPSPDHPANPAQQQGSPWTMIILMVGVFAVMWFLLIRPQKKEEKRRQELIGATKRGDKVVTIGGLHGTVEAVGEQTIDIRVGEDKNSVLMTFNKTAILTNTTANASTVDAAKK